MRSPFRGSGSVFFPGRPHPPEGVPDGADAHLEVGRPLPLEGVGMLGDVPPERMAVQLAAAGAALAR